MKEPLFDIYLKLGVHKIKVEFIGGCLQAGAGAILTGPTN